MRRDDDGAIQTLEAMLIAIVMVSAVGFVANLSSPSSPTEPARQNMQIYAEDSLGVLYETPANAPQYGNNWLSRAVAHCLSLDCSELRNNVEDLLPTGARYNVWLSNGYSDFPVYVPDLPSGETVVSSQHLEPKWSFTFLASDVNYTDASAGVPLGIVALPIQNSNVATEGGVPIAVVVNGSRSDGGNVSFTAYASTIQVAPGSIAASEAVSATFLDWNSVQAGYMDASNFTVFPGNILSGKALPLVLRLENAAGAKTVPAGATVKVWVPRDWNASAMTADNPSWTVTKQANDYNATLAGSTLEATLNVPLAAGATEDFTMRTLYQRATRDFYTFTAAFGDDAQARAEMIVRGGNATTPSRIDYPTVAFSVPKPMGATQASPWTVALSAPLLNTTGATEIDVTVTRMEVYAPQGYDLFDVTGGVTDIKNAYGGTWSKSGTHLVWTGSAVANRTQPFELSWSVPGLGTTTPRNLQTAKEVPLHFEGYSSRIAHQFESGFYFSEIYPEDLLGTAPGYNATAGQHAYFTNGTFRSNPLWGFDNYTAGLVPSYRDVSAGGSFGPSQKDVPLGGKVTLDAEVQALVFRISEKGGTANATMRLYPPWGVDRKVPVWENTSLSQTVLSTDVNALITRDVTNDGLDDVIVGTAGGRVLALDGTTGKRVPGLSFTATPSGTVSAQVTHLVRATLDGVDSLIVGTDVQGAHVHVLDFTWQERYRWNKTSGEKVLGLDASVDINSDGKTDVLVALSDGKVYALDGTYRQHGFFLNLTPSAHPSDSFFHESPGTPDGGLSGLEKMGPANEKGFASAMSTLPGVSSIITLNTADPAQSKLGVSTTIALPRSGMHGVNENGTVKWTYYGTPVSHTRAGDLDADTVSDVVVGSSAGFVAGVNGAQAAQPLYSLLFVGMQEFIGSHVTDEDTVYFVTREGVAGFTDDGFTTIWCGCDPILEASIPLVGARNISLDPSNDNTFVVGDATKAWTGLKVPASHAITFVPVVWGVTHTLEGCVAPVSPCVLGSMSMGNNDLIDVFFKDDTEGWIIGNQCTVGTHCYESLVMRRDAPLGSWRVLSKDQVENLAPVLQDKDGGYVTKRLTKINWTTDDVGWILGHDGTLLRSTNGGDNWAGITLPAALDNMNVTDISCIPNGGTFTCWVLATRHAGVRHLVYRTDDALTATPSWTIMETGTTRAVKSIGFIDENRGYMGARDAVLSTWNGGVNWTRMPINYLTGTGHVVEVFPSGHGYILGGNITNSRVFFIRDFLAESRAVSTSAWSCTDPCEINDVTVVPDGSYQVNGTNVGGAWAQFFINTTAGGTQWLPFNQQETQVRDVEAYWPLNFTGNTGTQLRWRVDLHTSHDVSLHSPRIRTLTLHVNYTEDGDDKYATVIETFDTTAKRDATLTTADWNIGTTSLRNPYVTEFWARNVNGSVQDMVYSDLNGDGTKDVVAGTGAILALNDPLYIAGGATDPQAAVGVDNRVYVLDGADNGAVIWQSKPLAGPVSAVAVADFREPSGAPDAFVDVIVAVRNATSGKGDLVAFAGADGRVLWQVGLDEQVLSLGIAEDPGDPSFPMPVAGTAGINAGPGYVYGHSYDTGTRSWKGTPDLRGLYTLTLGIPEALPLGPYIMELEVYWDDTLTTMVGGSPVTENIVQTSRLYNYFNVVPADDPMPLSPIYTVKLVTWLGDWDYTTSKNLGLAVQQTGQTTGGGSGGGSGGGGGGGAPPSYKDCIMKLCELDNGEGWDLNYR